MKYTANYNLKKPEGTDVVNVDDLNDNADIIDSELKKLTTTKVDKVTGKGLSTNDYTDEEKQKLAGLETGAEKNKVISVNGKTGAVTVTKSDVGLGNVDNIKQATKVEFDAHKEDYTSHTIFCNVQSSGGNPTTYTLTPTKPISGSLPLGAGFVFRDGWAAEPSNGYLIKIAGTTNAPSELLTPNGTKAKLKPLGMYTIRWNGSNFILQGEGGEYGTAEPSDVIKGKTIGTEDGVKTGTLELTGNAVLADVLSGKTFYQTNPKAKSTGTMPNRGAINNTITTQGGQIVVPQGYHNGTGIVKAHFANLTPSVVKKGINVGGVVGTFDPRVVLTDFGVSHDPYDVKKIKDFNINMGGDLVAIIVDGDQGYFTQSTFPASMNFRIETGRNNARYYLTRIEVSGISLWYTIEVDETYGSIDDRDRPTFSGTFIKLR